MILRSYSRILTTDLETTVEALKAVHVTDPHLRFSFDPWTLVGIGDVLAVGGTDETLEPTRSSHGPWIVKDVDDMKTKLLFGRQCGQACPVDARTCREAYLRSNQAWHAGLPDLIAAESL